MSISDRPPPPSPFPQGYGCSSAPGSLWKAASAYDLAGISDAVAARSAGGERTRTSSAILPLRPCRGRRRTSSSSPRHRRPAVQLVGFSKRFGDVVAVDGIDLVIDDGEFFSLLGPSGSGKTTVLRMIAGFELPTAGAVLLAGQDVTGTRAVRPRPQHRVPGLRPVPAPRRPAQRRVRAQGQGRAQGRAAAAGRRDARCGAPVGVRAGAGRTSSAAVSASASRSPAHSSTAPRCCSSTSRSAPSTSSCARRCRSS